MPLHSPATLRPLLPRHLFLRRMARSIGAGLAVVGVALGIGVVGYRVTAGLGWVDATLNASMILTGMGPVDPMPTTAAKLFAAAYALFSGVLFLTTVAVMFAPGVQRFLHRVHLDAQQPAEPA